MARSYFPQVAIPSYLLLCIWIPLCWGLSSIDPRKKFLIVGGTGQIGSAIASHLLLRRDSSIDITLLGRNQAKGDNVLRDLREAYPDCRVNLEYQNPMDQSKHHHERPPKKWVRYFQDNAFDCIIHTAGPYGDSFPTVLAAAIQAETPVYVDVSDPLPYLEYALLMNHTAYKTGKTTALVASGAFPGMSNVLAMETAQHVMDVSGYERVGNLRCQYFTAGLGGSGAVNLYITNLGFGDAMGVYQQGELTFSSDLSGVVLGPVDFFLTHTNTRNNRGNEEARQRIGTKQVFAWPFPEAATVPTLLKARGNSIAAMGTAPDIWNVMLGVLVFLTPRWLWREKWFSQFLADFSEPLVRLTDAWLKYTDPKGIGETHAMRIDVDSVDGLYTGSIVQAHDSFRQCVGQSCAEFALDCLENPSPGVSLPEQRFSNREKRETFIKKLTETPGTFCYTGLVVTANDENID